MRKPVILVAILNFLIFNAQSQQWATSGTNIYNANTGNVGIGTTTPAVLLEVRNGKLNLFNSGGSPAIGNHSLLVGSTSSAVQLGIGTDGYNTSWLQSYQADNSLFKPLLLNPLGGNIGIGTTNPLNGLHVFSANNYTGGTIRFGFSTSNDGVWSFGANPSTGIDALKFSVFPHNATSGQSDLLTIALNGNAGIGTTNPLAKLDVNGAVRSPSLISNVSSMTDNFTHNGTSFNNYGITWVTDSWQSGGPTGWLSGWGGIKLFTGGNPSLSITMNGNVLIGKTSQINTAYMLDIAGPVRANQLVVNTTGADFVFEPGYKLAPLSKVEEFIKTKHYLPGIAPAAQMQKDGLDVGDNQTKLLQKIEELTLYIIDQDKKNEALNNTVNAQSKLLQQQQVLLEKMQKEIDALQSATKK